MTVVLWGHGSWPQELTTWPPRPSPASWVNDGTFLVRVGWVIFLHTSSLQNGTWLPHIVGTFLPYFQKLLIQTGKIHWLVVTFQCWVLAFLISSLSAPTTSVFLCNTTPSLLTTRASEILLKMFSPTDQTQHMKREGTIKSLHTHRASDHILDFGCSTTHNLRNVQK